MAKSQRIGDGSDKNQQIQADGDVKATFATDGGVSIGGGNHGIIITSMPTPEEPRYTFDITSKTRIPTPASLIGIVSGLITIAGFATGVFSVEQLIGSVRSASGVNVSSGMPKAYWWALGFLLAIVISAIGWSCFAFLRRNVLRLPKHSFFPAWAGIKEENGRTYPYVLRLAMKCPKCKNQRLRFRQVPEKWVDFYDGTGRRTKRDVTSWVSMALCPRNPEHSIRVDVSGNDFDEALPR